MKRLTHLLAAGVALVWAFAMSPAGQALFNQYPKLAVLASGVSTILALYHQPKEGV